MRVLLASLGALLCACGAPREHGFWATSIDASVRIPAEASVGGFNDWPPVEAGCSLCPRPGDADTCPATWAEASGDAGIDRCPAAECAYPEGTCLCILGCEDPGGSALGGGWSCIPATPECPSPPPESGTPCGDSGAYCEYGSTCCIGSLWAHCAGGIWETAPGTGCP